MSTSTSWMKSILFTLIILISFIGFNNGQETHNINTINQPADFGDAMHTRKMVSRCQPNGTQNCYLLEAVQLILFYGKDGSNIDATLDGISDSQPLTDLLTLSLQAWLSVFVERPDLIPSEFKKNI